MGDRTYVLDANNILSDNAAAYTASGYAQSGGADGIVDVGGNQGISVTLPSIADVSSIKPQQPRIDAVVVVDVTAIKISSSNETYKLIVVGSNDPSFGAAAVECLGEIMLGKGASRDGTNLIDSVIGRYEIMLTNEQANQKYQYIKINNVIGGTTPSISYQAFLAVLPEP